MNTTKGMKFMLPEKLHKYTRYTAIESTNGDKDLIEAYMRGAEFMYQEMSRKLEGAKKALYVASKGLSNDRLEIIKQALEEIEK